MEPRSRILVVDDERGNRELLEANLISFGYDVDLAADGLEALAMLNPAHDLVLLDVMMPGIDGFETARRIRGGSNCSDVPICMVTALSGKEQRLHAVECGANDFIAKPIDRMEVKIRTASLVRIKQSQDAVRDFQARLEAKNAALMESLAELERAAALKDEFIGIASHDLKNPLTCIMGFAFLVESGAKPGTVITEAMYDNVVRITAQAQTMVRVISNFLDFQSMEDGRMAFHPEELDMNEIARDALELNLGHALRKGIELAPELTHDLPPVFADASQIGQVVDNLVSNALKFADPQSHVCVRTVRREDAVLLEVVDNGPGLTEDDLPKLFVKYAIRSNEPTGGESSTGMGLAICKRLIELNGGTIGGRNNEGPGATFWIRLVPHGGVGRSFTEA